MRRARVWTVLASVAVLALVVAAVSPNRAQAAGVPYAGLVAMGMPATPLPYAPTDFAITKHTRQTCGSIDNGFGPPVDGGNCPMTADHGTDCAAPPATHQIGQSYRDMLFICHDHMMTAINAGGTGVIAFQPNQLIDVSGGASFSIARSTAIKSSRDWTEIYLTPFADQLAYNIDGSVAEQPKEPKNGLHILFGTNGNGGGNQVNEVSETINGVTTDVPCADCWNTLEGYTGLVDSATVRTPILMTLSTTHFSLAIAGHTFWNGALPHMLPFTQLVMQVQHVSYDPEKAGGGAVADTWHWSDLDISNAIPYYLQPASPDAAGDVGYGFGLGNKITFSPAPSGAFLRFQAFNVNFDTFASGYDISFDNGATWTPWHYVTPQDDSKGSFWQPIPAGAGSALLRGKPGWYARDFYVMALSGAAPVVTPTAPAPTATSVPPTVTPKPTIAPTATAPAPTPTPAPNGTPISGVPCTILLNGKLELGTCSGTFSP